MSPTEFQLAVISIAVIINIPMLGFIALNIWKLDVRLARVETRLDHPPLGDDA